ncbi:MAG: DUF2188 domain-containing protein, partial [Bacillota bacterium]
EKAALAQKKAEKVVVEEKKVEVQKQEFIKQSPIVEKKVQTSTVTEIPIKTVVAEAQTKKEVPIKEEVKKEAKLAKYHVSQNKDPRSDSYRKWRVRKEGSEKTIKFFDTQKEAIEFAGGLAITAQTSVVIHKMDGSIRKQDYTKKA